jgi:hypothetical protein
MRAIRATTVTGALIVGLTGASATGRARVCWLRAQAKYARTP